MTLIVVLAGTLSAGFFSLAANSEAKLTLELGGPPVDIRSGENIKKEPLVFRVGEALHVLVKNLHDEEVFLPAERETCAVITIQRRSNDAWQNWSTCELLRKNPDPFVIAPGLTIEDSRYFNQRRPIANSEVDDGIREPNKPPADNHSTFKSVEQTIITKAEARFFERFGTLPAGEYQLTTSYAFSERPEDIRIVQSAPFSVIEKANGQ